MVILGGFYDDAFKYPEKYKYKLVSLFIIVIGLILNFYIYTQVFTVKYGLLSRILILIISIIQQTQKTCMNKKKLLIFISKQDF